MPRILYAQAYRKLRAQRHVTRDDIAEPRSLYQTAALVAYITRESMAWEDLDVKQRRKLRNDYLWQLCRRDITLP